MKKIITLFLSVLLITGIFTSCSSDDPIVLFFAVENPAVTFDPQIVSDATAGIIVRNCFEGLVRKDENGNIINGVAEKLTVSPDGLTYTFKLRQNALWHLTSNAKKQLEGKIPEDFPLSVTAYDFQFALRRACDPATGAHLSYMLQNIVNAPEILSGAKNINELGVRVLDKYTLEIKLSKPQSNFTQVLTEPMCMPCNETFFNACSGRYGTLIAFSLSNGPFYLSRFDETSYRINKSADYAGESTAVPDYVWLYVTNEKDELKKVLETDDYSGAVISEEVYSSLKIKKSMTVTPTRNITRSFIFNSRDEVLGNPDIRKALCMATDCSLVAANAGKTAAPGLVPGCAAAPLPGSSGTAFNESEASVYLKKGLEALEKKSADVVLLCESAYEETMRRLLQQWQKILGISINFSVKTGTAEEVENAVSSGTYQIAFYPLTAKTDSCYEFFGTFLDNSPFNITGFSSENTMGLLSGLYSGDENTFNSVYSSIENEILSANTILPVWSENSYFVCTKNVRGVIYFSGNDKLYFHKATNIKE